MAKRLTYRLFLHACWLMAAIVLSGCSVSGLALDGGYLLDEVKITSDNKELKADKLEPYVRQRANRKWLAAAKVPLATYSLAGEDTTKWVNRALRNIGEAPVIFDSIQARRTCEDMALAMYGMGYVRATADYELTDTSDGKAVVTYKLHPGPQYQVGTVTYDIQDEGVKDFLSDGGLTASRLTPGAPFLIKDLDDERKRVTALLNNNGYFNFNKDFISFSADTVRGETTVDLTLHLRQFITSGNAEPRPHKRYRVASITYRPTIRGNEIPLRQSILEENTLIEKGKLFNASTLRRTYNKFGRLPIIKYTNIRFTEIPDSDALACDIRIGANKANSVTFQPEGTNTAGDLGAAASLTYENKNLFKGSETLSIKLRGAFEAITGLEGYQNENYEEYNIETRVTFPRFVAPLLSRRYRKQSSAITEFSTSFNMQNRPEFHRRVFTAGWRYRWSDASRRRTFKIDLPDMDYIYMPWISATFKKEYLDDVSSRNSILRYNYEDLFIMKMGFGMSYNGGDKAFKINVESAGNVLSGVSRLIGGSVNEDNQRKLFNIAFAQYVKGDFEYTHLLNLGPHNKLALHAGLGIAYPYGNSRVLPFEKRYFSGGANSVRGWNVRRLGPGRFKGTNGSIDFINQTGDIKLDLNVELRSFLFWKIYGAAFVDAGNIWTLRYYEEQDGGQFDIAKFYEQMAVAYGVGVRLNLDFFILRFDFGMKAINPAYETRKEHYAVFHPRLSRDFAFHFAVGLPF